MRFAETVRSRWLLALTSIALAGTITAFAWPTETPPPRTMKPWRACGQRIAKPTPPPPPQIVEAVPKERTGADYQRILSASRDQFAKCVVGSNDIEYKLTIMVLASGRVESVDVRANLKSSTPSRVDMHVIKCLQDGVSSLTFPPAKNTVLVSTTVE